MTDNMIWAFDLGKASQGHCVRQQAEILELEAHLFETTKDATVASTDALKTRRRAYRTRQAHKARELYLQKTWLELGLEVPDMSSAMIQREFPAKNDDTIYGSALLRVALLQGQNLKPWQVYKALWSALQRRGYDAELPWAASQGKSKKETPEESLAEAPPAADSADEKENQEGLAEYQNLLETHIKKAEFFLPCYLEASLMGLWSADRPDYIQPRIETPTTSKVRSKGRVAPRHLVEKECRLLLQAAARLIPQLAGKEDEILYGPSKTPYASYRLKSYKRFRGTERDWAGILSQKVPRFDNRVIAKCQLMPERNVCKGSESLNLEVKLLLQLKNFRYTNQDGEIDQSLTAAEIKAIFNSKIKVKPNKKNPETIEMPVYERATQIGGVNAGDLRKLLNLHVEAFADTKVEALKLKREGRSRFCRPALRILKAVLLSGHDPAVLLSGQSPPDFDITSFIEAEERTKGVTEEEVRGVIRRLGETWQNIHIGDDRNEALQLSRLERRQRILWTIGSVNNPVVRHRLTWFWNTLRRLESKHGIPEKVILEFVRDDKDNTLEGKKKASDRDQFMKKNEKYNEELRQTLENAGLSIKHMVKLKLLEQQGGKCIYTGNPITPSMFDSGECQIDHIVPVSLGGNDELNNKVLCTKRANQDKGDQTPYLWLYGTPQWDEYKMRVEQCIQNRDPQRKIGKQKYAFLLSPNAIELIKSYNALAETAYIARLAQKIIALHFGWPMQVEDEKRRIFVSNGKNTAKIRNIYQLNNLLYTPEELAKQPKNRPVKKNRNNNRHHAVDAYCISFSQSIYEDTRENGTTRFIVPHFSKRALIDKLEQVVPQPKRFAKESGYPEETIYALKQRTDESTGKMRYYLTVMKPLKETFLKEQDPKKIRKKIWDECIREDLAEKAATLSSLEWASLLENYNHPKRKSRVRRICLIVSESDEAPIEDSSGRRSIGEYRDFGKGKTQGQFKRGKKHQGQLFYFDKNNKVKVRPIYGFESVHTVKQQLEEQGLSLYEKGVMFFAGCMITTQKDFQCGKTTSPAGIYLLRTIRSAGPVLLESLNGVELLTSTTYLVEAGVLPYIPEEIKLPV